MKDDFDWCIKMKKEKKQREGNKENVSRLERYLKVSDGRDVNSLSEILQKRIYRHEKGGKEQQVIQIGKVTKEIGRNIGNVVWIEVWKE